MKKLLPTLSIKISDRINALSFIGQKRALVCEGIIGMLSFFVLINLILSTVIWFLNSGEQQNKMLLNLIIVGLTTICLSIPTSIVYSFIRKTRKENYFFLKLGTVIVYIIFLICFLFGVLFSIISNLFVIYNLNIFKTYAHYKDNRAYQHFNNLIVCLYILISCDVLIVITSFICAINIATFQEKLKIINNIIQNNYYSRHLHVDYEKTFFENNKEMPAFLKKPSKNKNK